MLVTPVNEGLTRPTYKLYNIAPYCRDKHTSKFAIIIIMPPFMHTRASPSPRAVLAGQATYVVADGASGQCGFSAVNRAWAGVRVLRRRPTGIVQRRELQSLTCLSIWINW